MSTYTSQPVTLTGSQADAYNRLSHLSAYQPLLDQLPADLRAKAGDVHFTDTSIIINANPVGEMRFDISRTVEPELIEFKAANAPVPMVMSLSLSAESADATTLVAKIDLDVPAILRPMIGGKMQEAANQMATLVANIYNSRPASL